MLKPKITTSKYNLLLKASMFFMIGFLFLAGLFQGLLLSNKGSNLSATDNAYQFYYNEQFHYSISYPENWKLDPVISNTNVVTISSAANLQHLSASTYSLKGQAASVSQMATTPAIFSKVDILAYSLEEPLSVTEFVSSLTKSPLEGQVSQRQIAGQTALLVELNKTTGKIASLDDFSYRNAFITRNRQGFIIAGLTSAATFDHIIESFQLD